MKFKQPVKPNWRPHAYQRRGVQFGLGHCAAGFFLSPGLGKTSIVLKMLQILKQQGLPHRALVIAPLRVCWEVWPAEIKKWADFEGMTCAVLHGSRKEQALDLNADIFVINPEGLPWLLSENRIKKLGAEVLVIDESSKFRHTNTQRFKLLRPLLPKFHRRHILTGSPAPKSYLDLFGQIYILDLGNALGAYVSHYRANYFYPAGFMGYEWKLNEGAEQAIQRKIKPLVLCLDETDYLKLPKLTSNVIRVTLPDAARKAYDELEEEMITVLEDREITAVNAAVASMKCCQVANGGLYHAEDPVRRAMGLVKRESVVLHDAKTEALKDLVEEMQGAPLLVCYEYDHDLERIQKALGKNVPYIAGGVTAQNARKIIERWNAGELPVLLGHPASVAHGLNLQYGGCNAVCFYSLPWDYELYDQFIRRVLRQGNKNSHVIAHHIIASNTVDEAKLAGLVRKEKGQKGLLDALRTYVRERHSS